MNRFTAVIALSSLMLVTAAVTGSAQKDAAQRGPGDNGASEHSKIQIGFEIAPVTLNMAGRNPSLVGLGSYIVNGHAGCNDCHAGPPSPFADGGDPFAGEPEVINPDVYLAGGSPNFGPFVPRNLTPNADGLPANLTLNQFLQVLNTGADLKHRPPFVPSADNDLLQIMPWPIFKNMTDREKIAIYEYLRAIPCLGSATRCGS